MYTVGESATLYASQGQYYAANTGTTAATGYSTTGTHYLVQQTVDADALIASTRNSPQTTSAVISFSFHFNCMAFCVSGGFFFTNQ